MDEICPDCSQQLKNLHACSCGWTRTAESAPIESAMLCDTPRCGNRFSVRLASGMQFCPSCMSERSKPEPLSDEQKVQINEIRKLLEGLGGSKYRKTERGNSITPVTEQMHREIESTKQRRNNGRASQTDDSRAALQQGE